jgi:hypothetical protein
MRAPCSFRPAFVLIFFVSVAGLRLPAAEQPWQLLFNGKSLDGWRVVIGNGSGADTNHLAQVDKGAVHMYKDAADGSQQPSGYIVTEKEYANYHLRLEYKWGEKRFAPRAKTKRDAGILYHVIGKDGVWPTSIECQIQENDVGDIWTVRTQVMGFVDPATTNIVPIVTTNAAGKAVTNQSAPIYLPAERGGIPFIRGTAKGIQRLIRSPMNEHEGWNTVEVIVHGDQATYIVNGKVNNEASRIREFVDGHWVPLTKGRIALQLEFAEVFYRNVEIQELSE